MYLRMLCICIYRDTVNYYILCVYVNEIFLIIQYLVLCDVTR